MYDPLIVDVFITGHREISTVAKSLPENPKVNFATAGVALGASATAPAFALDEIAASTEENLTLFDLARSLSTPMSVGDAADVITAHLRRLVPFTVSVLYLYNSDTDELIAAHSTDEGAALASGMRILLGERISGWVAAHRKPIRNSDPVLDFGEAARSFQPRLNSSLAAPIVAGDRLTGVLSLYSNRTNAFTEGHQRIVEVVSRQVSEMIASAVHFDSTNAVSLRDPDTGLPNGRRLQQIIQSATGESLPYPMAALLIQFGSERSTESETDTQPERFMFDVVGTIRRILRPGDLLFRSAALELVALLSNADQEPSREVASRLKSALTGRRGESGVGQGVAVNVVASSLCYDTDSIERFVRLSRRSISNAPHSLRTGPGADSKTIH